MVTSAALAAAERTEVRNVILIIGDGMDEQQITIARNYLKGAAGTLTLDELPMRSNVQVQTVAEENPSVPLYVAESAGSGTALATGHVTSRARIATAPATDRPLQTILELAQDHGLGTGVITSASLTDATPAVFMSHINIRMCENPQSMLTDDIDCSQYRKANGGAGSIAEQIVDSGVQVLLGGGRKHFDITAEGASETVLAQARANGLQLLTSIDEPAEPSARLLGIFADEHLPVRMRGSKGRTGEKPDPSLLNNLHWALGDVTLPPPMQCEPDPTFANTPTLAQMTERAISHLARDPQRGFILIIESASIDKRAHARDACGSIGELEQLEESVRVALEFAEDSDTLLLVTADHSQAAQIVPDQSLFAGFGIPVYTPGNLVRISMPHGGTMAINYATNDFFVEEHTGASVPLFANRQDAEIPVFMQQTQVFHIMRKFLGLPAIR